MGSFPEFWSRRAYALRLLLLTMISACTYNENRMKDSPERNERMRKHKVAVFFIKLAVFVCLLAAVLNTVGQLLDAGDDVVQSASALKSLPPNSVDVCWLGTSHMNYNVIPQYLYDLCGIPSTMVTGNSLDLTSSYWQLRQALLTQSPQVVVLDVYAAAAPYCYFYVQNVLATRYRQGMQPGSNPYNTATGLARWLPIGSPYKPAAISHSYAVSGADGDAYFQATRLHARYSELGRASFAYACHQDRWTRNFGYLYGAQDLTQREVDTRPYTLEAALAANEVGTYWTFSDAQLSEAHLLAQTREELERIIHFTREKGIQLVLCAAPYLTNQAEEKLFDEVAQLAYEQDVPFVGLDASGIEGREYLRDIGHLNDAGARLYTAFWADYLTKAYALPDRRESADACYAPWRDNAGSYDVQSAAMQLLTLDGGLTKYLEAISTLNDDYLLVFSIEGEVYEGFTEDDYLLMTEQLGFPEETLEEWYLSGMGTQDAALSGDKLLKSAYAPDGRAQELHWNLRGHDIKIGCVNGDSAAWSVDGDSLGRVGAGMNIAVYSLIDHMLMDARTFDLTQPAWDE